MDQSEFRRQPRGRQLFDLWLWKEKVRTAALGEMDVELQLPMDGSPNDLMTSLAAELVEYVQRNDGYLLDLVYGHYRYAEVEGWLSFWDVPSGVSRAAVLKYVRSIALVIDSDHVASVFVDPLWELEHKLDLFYEGSITEINGQSFQLINGVLSFTPR